MTIPYFQIDSFASEVFKGNPAGVCIVEHWPDDDTMQKIAMENNLSETAFVLGNHNPFQIRWFTPKIEVDLCGHATLASAHVLFHHLNFEGDTIEFESRSGLLTVTNSDKILTLNFPADKLVKVHTPKEINEAFGVSPAETYKGKTDYLCVFNNEDQVRQLTPDFRKLATIEARGIMVTSLGKEFDFVTRFFAPQVGIDEDPVTGSAFTSLTVYWADQLKKESFIAAQISERLGIVHCKLINDRVQIGGHAVTFKTGQIIST